MKLNKIVKSVLKKNSGKEDLYPRILSKINNNKKTIELWSTPDNGNYQNGGKFFINAKQNKKKTKKDFVERFDYVYIYKNKVYKLDYSNNKYKMRKCKEKEIMIYVKEGLYLPISKGKVVKKGKELVFKKK